MSNVQHKWKEIKKETDYPHLKSVHICTRGDCRCKKHVYVYKGKNKTTFDTVYIREGRSFNVAPECFGDTPLNDQKDID